MLPGLWKRGAICSAVMNPEFSIYDIDLDGQVNHPGTFGQVLLLMSWHCGKPSSSSRMKNHPRLALNLEEVTAQAEHCHIKLQAEFSLRILQLFLV